MSTLRDLTPEQRKDKAFMLNLAKTEWYALREADVELQKDPEFVLKCMRAATPIEAPKTSELAEMTAGEKLFLHRRWQRGMVDSVFMFADQSVRCSPFHTIDACAIDAEARHHSTALAEDWQTVPALIVAGRLAPSPPFSHAQRATARGSSAERS